MPDRFHSRLACFLPWLALLLGAGSSAAAEQPVTFNRDVAPVLFQHCSPCHRPGEEGPFPLFTFAETKRKIHTIVEVTSRRCMPPWQPAPQPLRFLGDRHLTDEQIAVFRRWRDAGLPEGEPRDLPPRPEFGGPWQFVEPDLILQPGEPYPLGATGPGLYRNLVITVPACPTNRYVRAMQFRPESRAVHHAIMLVDRHGGARKLDACEPAPGFPGLDLPDGMESPGSHFLSWQPGRRGYASPPGLAWVLPAGADVVIQLHLQPTGKPEAVAPRIGLYFTNRPPEREFFKLDLASLTMDFAPGATDQVVTDSFVLPDDVQVIAVNPHCHFLGRDLLGLAILPDGRTNQLLHVLGWNFNWQGDYRFANPVPLPKGTRLQMRYVFDNSTNNPFNPHNPPIRVRYGVQTQDETAELWFQMLPSSPAELAALRAAYAHKALPEIATYQQYRLRLNPQDAHALGRLGVAKWQLGQPAEGLGLVQKSLALEPQDDFTHYHAGLMLQDQGDARGAEQAFAAAVRLNPGTRRPTAASASSSANAASSRPPNCISAKPSLSTPPIPSPARRWRKSSAFRKSPDDEKPPCENLERVSSRSLLAGLTAVWRKEL